jgi:hypothetical protein
VGRVRRPRHGVRSRPICANSDILSTFSICKPKFMRQQNFPPPPQQASLSHATYAKTAAPQCSASSSSRAQTSCPGQGCRAQAAAQVSPWRSRPTPSVSLQMRRKGFTENYGALYKQIWKNSLTTENVNRLMHMTWPARAGLHPFWSVLPRSLRRPPARLRLGRRGQSRSCSWTRAARRAEDRLSVR